jgi:Arc/MetJ-type ribon-helix-helix transcriptional regulator
MTEKNKLSVTVDQEVVEAARVAVSSGRVGSVSAWVNEALHRQMDHERRLRGLDRFLAAYEAEHGAISDEEMAAALRSTRAAATVVRGKHSHGAA